MVQRRFFSRTSEESMDGRYIFRTRTKGLTGSVYFSLILVDDRRVIDEEILKALF